MTPEEKAKDLFDTYRLYQIRTNDRMEEIHTKYRAKRCAEICVNEIISACEYNLVETYNTDWWNKVKEEINKL